MSEVCIAGEELYGAGEGIQIKPPGNEPVSAVLDEILGPTDIGDDDGEAACLGLDHDVPKGVGGAGKDKEVGRGIRGGELLGMQTAGVDPLGKQFLHHAGIRTVTDDEGADGDAGREQAAHRRGEEVEVLFPGNAADIEDTQLAVAKASPFPEVILPFSGMKEAGIEASREDAQLPGGDAAVDPAPAVVLGVHVDGVKLGVEPVHVVPCQRFHQSVLGEDADIFRKIRVVDAGGGEAKHLGGRKCGKAHRAGCADDDLGEVPRLEIIDDLQERRKTQLLQLVLGQLKLPDRREVLERNPRHGDLLARHHDLHGLSVCGKGAAHALDRGRDTVHIVKRVGEPGAARVAQLPGQVTPQQHGGLAEALTRRRPESVEIRTQERHKRHHRTDHLDALQKTTLHQLLQKLHREPVSEPTGHHVGHQEGTTTRFLHSLEFLIELRPHGRFVQGA